MIFFGLTNLPAIFQAMMNKLLRDLINTEKVAVFINNIIVGTEIEEEHDEIVAEVIRRLEENNLYMKPEKCKWKVREVGFLGMVIGLERIKMEKEKVKGVLEWPIPKCVKDVQNFLGLANYYCRFIQNFASIVRLLYDIVKKDQKWEWTEKQERAFEKLKKKFTQKLVLVVLDLDKKNEDGGKHFRLCNGRRRLVTFLSKFLNKTEKL